jgi:hypothetical protein
MHEQPGNVSVKPTSELQRRGDVNKCPVCGSQIDPSAYHCPTCHCYFCYHCRARLLGPDTQLQCIHQDCDYYSKLICSVCDPSQETEEPPSVYAEPQDGYWPAWLVLSVVAGAVTLYFTSFLVAAGTAIAIYAAGGYFLHRAGINIFGRERKVEYQRRSSYHTCIRCQQRVKEVHSVA